MSESKEYIGAQRTLRRLLANGRLTAMPKRPSDQDVMGALAAARFDAGRSYDEAQVNQALGAWLEGVSEPFGIDHVTLRRFLVDSRLLLRTSSGSLYRLNEERGAQLEPLRQVDAAAILVEVQREREERRQRHAT